MHHRVVTTNIPLLAAFLMLCGGNGMGQQLEPKLDKPIPRGAKLFLAPVEGGFETYFAAALQQKKVPVLVVSRREMADYEVSAVAETEKAGWAQIIFLRSDHSTEQAGIKMVDLKTQEIVFAYAVHKSFSQRGKQSAAEACAKHLKERITQK